MVPVDPAQQRLFMKRRVSLAVPGRSAGLDPLAGTRRGGSGEQRALHRGPLEIWCVPLAPAARGASGVRWEDGPELRGALCRWHGCGCTPRQE